LLIQLWSFRLMHIWLSDTMNTSGHFRFVCTEYSAKFNAWS
jgi:hypothetical protein